VRRTRSLAILGGVLVAVVAAGVYLFGVNPLWNHINKGLDLQGGLHVVYQAVPTPEQPVTPQAMDNAVKVIRFRVDKLGVAEPVIQQFGRDRIIVELPGIKDPEGALQVIGKVAKLEFRDEQGHVVVTGAHLQSADAEIDQTRGNVVVLHFDAAGTKAIADFTSKNVGRLMPIYIDDQMVMNPTIRDAITNGQALLEGGFPTLQDAQKLAVELNSGALPLQLKVIENRAVSATLGADSIARSLRAAAVAMALIVAFMVTVYRIPGFWADLALAVYAMLLLAVLWAIHATLTLPGITGVILSLGMAVDANVIIYERIKEELRGGRTLRSAVDEGFRNGFRAVFDSNATTVIAAAVLFWLGSGPIRGFAVTLGVGVMISMLTAVAFTHYILHRLADAGARPSAWFFAPRGGAGAAVSSAAGVAAPAAGVPASGVGAGAGWPDETGRAEPERAARWRTGRR
jgi:preprotein translocase subunit SecD